MIKDKHTHRIEFQTKLSMNGKNKAKKMKYNKQKQNETNVTNVDSC